MNLILPVQDWPKQDQVIWLGLTRESDPFEEPGALSHLRKTSLAILAKDYGQWLSWLLRSDPGALAEPPEARATMPRLLAWLEDLSGGAPTTRLMRVERTALYVLRAAAPSQDWQAQKRLVARLRVEARCGNPDRKVGRVLDSRVLLDAGLVHAGADADNAPSALQAARRRRDGMMIALLALVPMRRRAFTALTLGDSLSWLGERFVVTLSPEMTKTGRAWDAVVPDVLTPGLHRYIAEVRPFFMRRGVEQHDSLWVGERGAPIPYASIEERISVITQNLLGVRVPPHFFRDSAATTLARTAPEQARLIQPLLGYSTPRTAERHYIHAQTIEAGRGYTAALARRRRGKR